MPDTTVTITVVKKDEELATISFECDNFLISEEQGHQRIYRNLRGPPEIQSNGQWRIAFKAWIGCQDYDEFVADEQIDMPIGGPPEGIRRLG